MTSFLRNIKDHKNQEIVNYITDFLNRGFKMKIPTLVLGKLIKLQGDPKEKLIFQADRAWP